MRDAEWVYNSELKPRLPEETPLGNGLSECKVKFGADFVADIEFRGVLPPRGRYESHQPEVAVGELIKPWPEIEADLYGRKVVLEEVSEHGSTTNGLGEVTVPASASRIRIEWVPDALPHRAVFWCLNGPGQSELGWMRMSHRDVLKRSKRTLGSWVDECEGMVSGSSSSDHILLPTIDGSEEPAVLALVPKELCDPSFRPLGIHIALPPDGAVPDASSMDRKLELLSFILGRRLIPLGSSVLDKDLQLVRTVWRNAWSMNLSAECADRTMPPVPMEGGAPKAVPEPMIAALFSLLCGAPDEVGLNDVFWRIWIARGSIIETRLPILAGAMEVLMQNWFRGQSSKSKGSYYDNSAWRGVAARSRQVLEGDLGGRQYSERVLRRFDGLNNFGVNERFDFFFDEIGLSIGNVERRAIQARNAMAHGGASEGRLQALLDQERAYSTMLNRAILKIVGWEGEYLDYSARVESRRPLALPLGGPAGDGVAAG